MRGLGIAVFEMDIRREGQSDLTLRRVQRTVRSWFLRGLVAALWLGTPCTSFSRARERGPGGAIRTQQYPMGLAEVSAVDKEKIRIGNILARVSASLFDLAVQMQIPVALENPWTSWLWHMPGIRRLINMPRVLLDKFDFCEYGMPWRKRTGLMYYGVDLAPVFVCCEGRHLCSFTGRPHVILRGKDGEGRDRTLAAEPYPRSFCQACAKGFRDAIVSAKVASLLTVLQR